ncbi:hypothetical protein BYT27DRAFT_7205846 [Phlegmacium glaucopus]|nr:hypothetical protein BYT27DRAFT_7205846 [Phlegmacium glaucopus]
MDPNDTNSHLQAWFLSMIHQMLVSQGSTMPNTPTQQSVGPVMGQHHQHQYQPPSSRNQHSRRSRTETQNRNFLPGSSGTTTSGKSINNAGAGSAQRSPSANPLIVDCNQMQQRGRKPYDRNRSRPSIRRLHTDLSVYEVPITEMQTNATAGGSNIHAIVPSPAPSTSLVPTTSAPSTSSTSVPSPSPPAAPAAAPAPPMWAWMGTPETPDEDVATNEDINMQERPDEEEDYHTISSGSDTE